MIPSRRRLGQLVLLGAASAMLGGCETEEQFVDVAPFLEWRADCNTLCEMTVNESVDLISDICTYKENAAELYCEQIPFDDLWFATSGYNEADGARELGAACAAFGAYSVIYECDQLIANQ